MLLRVKKSRIIMAIESAIIAKKSYLTRNFPKPLKN